MHIDSVSTGILGIDHAIDMLRLGDNVVWQVDDIEDYRFVVGPYIAQAKKDQRQIIYIRFGKHPPVIDDMDGIEICKVNPDHGFESFSTIIHNIIAERGVKAFYVFDCLTELLESWYSDLMIGNFFKVTCPFLYQLDTIAYFAIKRNAHTFHTIAGIRETTQLLLDIYRIEGRMYVHPLKVWQRYSPAMFFPHYIHGDQAEPITASADAAELFSNFNWEGERMEFWHMTVQKARAMLTEPVEKQEAVKELLIDLLVGKKSRLKPLCIQYFKLSDIVKIASREIGTGYIGGKSVGMLLSRRIITRSDENKAYFKPRLESHDSFYLGSDIFYTYVVENGLWELRMKQKTPEGYFTYAKELKEKLYHGSFSRMLRDEFMRMLEYYGQSPIIVRSSSLLEDNFGNAFAGKYESVFCVNQGTPEERLNSFMDAVRVVYASTMNQDALQYRKNRGLSEEDEQMAILVQRVSGDYYGDYFFPHAAGVANSSNLYVYDSNIDMDAGMLRLVFGLGTRAVDRIIGDYVKIVALDDPLRESLLHYGEEQKYSQHKVDVLNLKERCWQTVELSAIKDLDIRTNKNLFWVRDWDMESRLREIGRDCSKVPPIMNFKKLLRDTDFPIFMRRMMKILTEAYEYPVDTEFTVNFDRDGNFKMNLVQCRPLQTRGLGKSIPMLENMDKSDCIFYSKGNFMGGNVRLPIDYIVFVSVDEYLALPEQGKYSIARQIGVLNLKLKERNALLIGPGRWGTTTPSLGVPVHFTELCYMSAICEVAYSDRGIMPELSYGSHFFQDLVEQGIFYTALFNDGRENVTFHEEKLISMENIVAAIAEGEKINEDVIRVYEVMGMELYSDILTQQVILQ